MKTKNLVYIAVLAAIICVFSPWAVPIGAVPVSLATFAVYFTAAVSGWKRGVISVLLFLLIGGLGVPVFSGFQGGFHRLIGPTGGYLIGYMPCAFITGLLADKYEKSRWIYPLGMIAGTVALYILGTAWFVYVSGTPLVTALYICVLPFLVGDALKIVVASAAAAAVRPILGKHSLL
jgi:biotin transport system substrate-specific component